MKFLKKFKKNLILMAFLLLLIIAGVIRSFMPITFSNFVTIENVWSGEVATSFSGGNGTLNNPYLISTGEEFAYFKQLIESDDNASFSDKYYALVNDINMGDLDFEPIGKQDRIFKGHLDGRGYFISNFKISKKIAIDANNYLGIFSQLDKATIENLNISDVDVDTKGIDNLYVGVVAGNIKNDSTIKNMTIHNSNIKLNDQSIEEKVFVGSVSGSITDGEISGVYLNTKIDVLDDTNIGSISGLVDSKSIFNNILVDSNITDFKTSSKTVYNRENVSENFLKDLNKEIDESYEWILNDNVYYLRTKEVKVIDNEIQMIRPLAISAPITAHASGVSGTTVYVNDLEADYNYYMGLNYTGSGNTLPTMENKKTYSDKNLVKVQITYSSEYNRNGGTLKGTVSTTENQDKYVYYKVLVVNNNGTSSTADDYIDIELIDNPFTNRPKDYGFNGWQTSYVGAEISYDDALYLRYVKVPVTYTGSIPDDIVIDFKASWTEADVHVSNSNSTSNLTNAISAFKDKGMQQRATTKTVQEPDYGNREDNDMGGYYVKETIPYNTNYPAGSFNANGAEINMATGQINTSSGLNVREGPGTGYDRVGALANRTTVNIHSGKVSGTGCNAGWYEISSGNTRGYGCSSYISNITYNKCTSSGGCAVYHEVSQGTKYNSNQTYYHIVNGQMTILDPNTLPEHPIIGYHDVVYDLFVSTDNMSGYYEQVTLNRNASLVGYYDNLGVLHNSGTCASTSCTYYKLIQYYDENGNPNNFVKGKKYYYLVTRDTNLIILTANLTGAWGNNQSKPLTITSSYGGTLYNAQWNLSGTYLKANDDLGIENITIYSNRTAREENPASGTETSRTLYGNWHNVKVGRGIKRTATNQVNFISAIGGGNSNTGSTSNLTKYRFIVESGFYNATSQTCGSYSSATRNAYIKGYAIYGNDYDRVSNNNSNLDVYYASSGSWGCYIRGSDRYDTAINQTYKSGRFGSAHPTAIPNNDSNNFTYGVYVGGRSYGRTHTTRRVTVEGGWIYNLIGGPLVDNDISGYNSVYIYMKGGEVEAIYGGAGVTETYGNRIIQVTDGTVNFSVFGGSNGITGSGSEGTLTGSPYIYIGGNATIGNATNVKNNSTLFGFEAGSIFGIGNGNDESSSIGTANNSYIIIDDNAHILKNVYGGGNYGAVGISSSSNSSETIINVLNGTIDGNVYGGGNRNGSGSTTKDAHVTINVSDGTIKGSIYGGSNEEGIIYGDVDINLDGGIVENDVYGGGYGGYSNSSDGTYVRDNIRIKVGNDGVIDVPKIVGSVYGGSAFGTVNGTNHSTNVATSDVEVVVNNGIISKSVFGGGKGNNTYTPYVLGNIKVTVNGGNIADVFGGNDAAGTPNGKVEIYLNRGTIGRVFGGGNNASVKTNHIYLQGSTVSNIFGGSNASGNVDEANIISTSGVVDTIYGGNNTGGETLTSNVTINGATINTAVYGGGKLATTGKTNVILNSSSIPAVYGGGERANVLESTNVIQKGSVVGNLYGGSNSGGDILVSNITISGGTITNAFGGNNAAGLTTDTNIVVDGGKVSNIYGGGNQVGVTNSHINLDSGTLDNVYGGSNQAGDVETTNIVTIGSNNGDLVVTNLYGGNNLGGTTASPVIDLKKGKYTNVYGGGNEAVTTGDVILSLSSLTVDNSVYGGGNQADVYGNTTVNTYGETSVGKNIFGGGNHGAIGQTITDNSVVVVNIAGAMVGGNVYGGCNTSIVHGQTKVNIGYNAIDGMGSSYGGDIRISGTVFGGGEANETGSDTYDFNFISVTQGIDILIDGTGYGANELQFKISGSIFGSGNASSSSGPSNIYIRRLGTRDKPNTAISIQRADMVVLDNSALELIGTTDRTNEYSSIKYSLNRIKNFKIKNSAALLLRENANMLENFISLVDVDGKEVKAVVTIDDESKTVTKNVDNRLYMLAGKNLNVTTNEAATTFGIVSGMTFLGMYQNYGNDSYVYGIYDDDMSYGSSAGAGDVITGGSYVVGLHNLNHDITVDGYYTNYIDDNYTELTTAYVEPTPPDSNYYMWTIGIASINYSVNLTASKYSSFGTAELSLMEFSKGNTRFNVIGFNGAGVSEGVSLIDSSLVPKLASSTEEANKTFGLSMKTETVEWTSHGTTKFIYEDKKSSYTGQTSYVTDSQDVSSSLMFYLYHAKNISSNQDIGTVVITLQALTPINEIEYETQLITISVTIDTRDYQDDDAYDASITYSKKYEMPSATNVNITNKSQFTTYFSLSAHYDQLGNFYGRENDYYHTLVSNYVLPVGTKITMIDFGINDVNPNYYYYIIDDASYQKAVNQLNSDHEVTYRLSNFIKMDSIDGNNTYLDSENNPKYFHEDIGFIYEEFIFIFDFQNANTSGESIGNTMLFELRNSEDRTVINVLSIRQNLMLYNMYETSNVVLGEEIGMDSNYLYYDSVKELSYQTDVGYNQTDLRQSIIDTNYESSNMGINISFYDVNNKQVSSTLLSGTTITLDGVTYYVDGNGVFRIKLTDKVSKINKNMSLVVGSPLPTGKYTLRISLFASSDGLHNSGDKNPTIKDIEVVVVGNNNLIISSVEDASKLVIGETGLNMNDSTDEKFTLTYKSSLANPNIRLGVYRRSKDSSTTNEYVEVDARDLFTNTFMDPTASLIKQTEYEYMVLQQPTETIDLVYHLQSKLESGTYRFVFKLYDGNELVDEDYEYVIIRKDI